MFPKLRAGGGTGLPKTETRSHENNAYRSAPKAREEIGTAGVVLGHLQEGCSSPRKPCLAPDSQRETGTKPRKLGRDNMFAIFSVNPFSFHIRVPSRSISACPLAVAMAARPMTEETLPPPAEPPAQVGYAGVVPDPPRVEQRDPTKGYPEEGPPKLSEATRVLQGLLATRMANVRFGSTGVTFETGSEAFRNFITIWLDASGGGSSVDVVDVVVDDDANENLNAEGNIQCPRCGKEAVRDADEAGTIAWFCVCGACITPDAYTPEAGPSVDTAAAFGHSSDANCVSAQAVTIVQFPVASAPSHAARCGHEEISETIAFAASSTSVSSDRSGLPSALGLPTLEHLRVFGP